MNEAGAGRHRSRLPSIAWAIIGAAGYYVLWPATLAGYWDGFWLILAGLSAGGNAGEWLARRSPRSRKSDGPGIFGVLSGVAIMAAVWLYLPAGQATLAAAVCRAAVGAYVGYFVAELLTVGPYRNPSEADNGTGANDEGGARCPDGPAAGLPSSV